LVAGLFSPSNPIRVQDDFESGNMREWKIENETRPVFIPLKDHDQNRIKTAVTWLYGELSKCQGRSES
jgi:hypothetical protein